MKTETTTVSYEGTNHQPAQAAAHPLRPLLALAGVAMSLAVASCAYPETGYGSASITTYQPGYRTTSLPHGYRTENLAGSTYYYSNGSYYQRNAGGYVVIDAPRQSRYYTEYSRSRNYSQPQRRTSVTTYQPGYRTTSLPRGYRSENLGGSTYYYHNGSYYQRNGREYVVTTAPRQSRYYAEYNRSR